MALLTLYVYLLVCTPSSKQIEIPYILVSTDITKLNEPSVITALHSVLHAKDSLSKILATTT